MAVNETAQQDFDYQYWLDDQQELDDLDTLEDLVQDVQEEIIEESLQNLESGEDWGDSDDLEEREEASELAAEQYDLSDSDLQYPLDRGGGEELEELEDLDELDEWGVPLEDALEDLQSIPDVQELDSEPILSSELEDEGIGSETAEEGFEEELFEPEITENIAPIAEEREELADFEEVDTTYEIEEYEEEEEIENLADLKDEADLEEVGELQEVTYLDELANLDELEELEDLQDLEDVDEFQEETDQEEFDDLDELDEINELESLEDLESSADYDESHEFDAVEDFVGHEDLEDHDKEDRFDDLADILELEAIEEPYELEAEIATDELDDAFDHSFWDSYLSPGDRFFNDFLQVRADFHLLNIQLSSVRSHAVEPPIILDVEPLPSPRPFGVSLDELPFGSPSFERDDTFLTSLEEQLGTLMPFRQWSDSTEDHLAPDTQPPLPTWDDPPDLVWETPILPEPPPYDFLEEFEPYETLEEQNISRQLANPFYPYSSRGRKKGSLRRVQQRIDHPEVNEPSTHSDSLPSRDNTPSNSQKSPADQHTLDHLSHAQASSPRGRVPIPHLETAKEIPNSSETTVKRESEGLGHGDKSGKPKISPFPVLVRKIRLKPDRNTGQYKEYGDVTLPQEFREKSLPTYFPDVQIGDYFQIKLTNLRTGKSGVDTRQIRTRDRLQFPRLVSRYFEYRPGDRIEFQFQKHFPQTQVKKVSSMKVLASFTMQKSGSMFRVNFSTDAKVLCGLNVYKKESFVHWQLDTYQGAGRLYRAKDIGITPASIGLTPKSPNFYAQLTIHNTRLTPDQVLRLGDHSRAQFVKTKLKPIQEVTGIQFTGRPEFDKERMLEYIIRDLTTHRLFDDVVKVQFHTPIQISNSMTIPNLLIKPDGILERAGQDQAEIIELKAFAPNTPVKLQKWEGQLKRYKSVGIPVNIVTTQDNLPEQLRHIPDRIYTFKDISKMVKMSKKSILRQLLDFIRQNWP